MIASGPDDGGLLHHDDGQADGHVGLGREQPHLDAVVLGLLRREVDDGGRFDPLIGSDDEVARAARRHAELEMLITQAGGIAGPGSLGEPSTAGSTVGAA